MIDIQDTLPSRVLDADGAPIVVYHGTKHEFEEFDLERSREGGIFFSADSYEAYKFASDWGYVFEAHLRMDNPMFVDGNKLDQSHTLEDMIGIIETARERGHDGVFIKDFRDHQREAIDTWIALDASNIEIIQKRNACDVRMERWRTPSM